jgi:hypothetical protein
VRRVALLAAVTLLCGLEIPAAAKAQGPYPISARTERGHTATLTVDSHQRVTKLHFTFNTGCSSGSVDVTDPVLHRDEQRVEAHTHHRHFTLGGGTGPMVPPLTGTGPFHHQYSWTGAFHVSRDGHGRVRVHATLNAREFGCTGPSDTLSGEYVHVFSGRSTDGKPVSTTLHGGLAVTAGGVLSFASPDCPNDTVLRVPFNDLGYTQYSRGHTWESKREVLADGTRHVVSHAEFLSSIHSGQLTISAWEDPQGRVRVHGIGHLRAYSRDYRKSCEGRAEFWLPAAN